MDDISDVIQEIETQTQLRKQKKQKWGILILLLLLLAGAGTSLWYAGRSGPAGNGGLIFFDESAQTGNRPRQGICLANQ